MKMTVKEAHSWASSFLQENHIENATMESELLLQHVNNWDRTQLFLNGDYILSDQVLEDLSSFLKRRVNREPLQHIIGFQNFYGRDFHVNKHVLIPRPETEILVEQILLTADNQWGDKPLTVIDIGSGSGAIAITLALERQNWKVHSVDISHEALFTAKQNAKRLKANVDFHHGDTLIPFMEENIKADVIVSNPPYIPSEDINLLMSEVKNYEPHTALDGGLDGLTFYRRIIEQVPFVLNQGGMIGFEVGINQSNDIADLLSTFGVEVSIFQDYNHIPRVVLGKYR